MYIYVSFGMYNGHSKSCEPENLGKNFLQKTIVVLISSDYHLFPYLNKTQTTKIFRRCELKFATDSGRGNYQKQPA